MGRAELKGLLEDAHAPTPEQAAKLGSRAALSPMRARPALHSSLGHAQVGTRGNASCHANPPSCDLLDSLCIMKGPPTRSHVGILLHHVESQKLHTPSLRLLLQVVMTVMSQHGTCCLRNHPLACAQLVTPKRRSARVPNQAPPSAGAMLARAGFAYAPNAALEARIGPAAAAGKLVLGDAQDEGVRAAMELVWPLLRDTLFSHELQDVATRM